MSFSRFDIAEAYYLFFTHYHSGQGSEEYRRLSKVATYFTPPHRLCVGGLSANGKAIYDRLVRDWG